MSEPLMGDATITWVIDEHTLGTYALRVPLQKKVPGHKKRRYASDSLNYKVRRVVTLGDGVEELAGFIPLEDNPIALQEMLIAGADGKILTYNEGGRSYPSMLIEPAGDLLEALIDPMWWPAYTDYEISIRLRAVSGTSYGSMWLES